MGWLVALALYMIVLLRFTMEHYAAQRRCMIPLHKRRMDWGLLAWPLVMAIGNAERMRANLRT